MSVGHRPKMVQNELECACVSVVFIFIPLVFHSPYSQWDMEVLTCFRPGFYLYFVFLIVGWKQHIGETEEKTRGLI